MDILLNFAEGQTGSVLGFFGIAITYMVTAIFDNPTKWSDRLGRGLYLVAGIIFFLLGIRCLNIGTVKVIDAGIVLAYLGIGAGLLCTAWTIRSHVKSFWIVFTIGIIFELIGFILEYNVGLVKL